MVTGKVSKSSKIAPPPPREGAPVEVGEKGEHTRNNPKKINYTLAEARGKKILNKDRGGITVADGSTKLRKGPGSGAKETSVWGQVDRICSELAKAHRGGTFTKQQLADALFMNEWATNGARPKYDPANLEGYAGWIETLVKGAVQKQFRCAEIVAQEDTVPTASSAKQTKEKQAASSSKQTKEAETTKTEEKTAETAA